MSVNARRLLLVLFSAALLAGCGSASNDAPPPSQKTAPKADNNGELRVGVTDGGIGTAARGDKRGVETLPNGVVKKPSNTQQGVGAGASCQNTDVMPSAQTMPTVVAATLCLLNGERQDAGLAPLTENPKLAVAAVEHSQDMVDQQYFDHVEKNGSDPVARIRAAGYIPSVGAWTIGENLAWGTGTLATPREIVGAWMKSIGHRTNILRPTFKEIGFGVVPGNPRSADGQGATYTTTFGGLTPPATAAAPKARSSRAKRRKARRARRARITRRNRAAARSKTTPSGSRAKTKPSGSRSTPKPSGSR